jgi:beta-RFAP synthase
MAQFRIQTGSRLHFGLLAYGPHSERQFGGLGLMIDGPGIELSANSADSWSAEGPLAPRVLDTCRHVLRHLETEKLRVPPLRWKVVRAPAEHAGLGTGTQLSLAIARILLKNAGRSDVSANHLARLSERGRRSGVGLHGFLHGGLIVDGGRRDDEGIPPLIARLNLPSTWRTLVVLPPGPSGRHGPAERAAFKNLPAFPASLTDRLCRLVLLGILPAAAEGDLNQFGSALESLQNQVGSLFAPVQGGIHATPLADSIVAHLRSIDLHGVGQSSWGPALYAFSDNGPHEREAVRQDLLDRFSLESASVFWTTPRTSAAAFSFDPS